MMFTKHELETILYSLEGYIRGNDDDKLSDELVGICDKIIEELAPVGAYADNDNAPVIINLPEGTNLKKVVRTPAQSPQKNNLDLHKIVKDYPRDAFAIALLPLLLLEALTKEGLKYAGVSL